MYRTLIRPLLFKIPVETTHNMTVGALRLVGWMPGGRWLLGLFFTRRHTSLEREVFGMKFANPVGLAAGFDKNAECYREIGALGFGFVEIGTVTPKAQPGNPKPRVFRLPKDNGLINRMGLNNDGMDSAAHNLRKKRGSLIVGANLGKNTLTPNENAAADYLKVFRRLYQYADYFVINVSCPNVINMTALQNKDNIREIVTSLLEFRRGQNQYRPILLKISPDLGPGQTDDMIDVVKEYSLDGIVATNTTTSREGLVSDPSVVDKIGRGGLSGAPLTGRALEMVRYIYEKTGGAFPIIGSGGVMTSEDAKNMLDAGATLVQVYTGMIYQGPAVAKKICRHFRHSRQAAATSTVPSTPSIPFASGESGLSATETPETPEVPSAT